MNARTILSSTLTAALLGATLFAAEPLSATTTPDPSPAQTMPAGTMRVLYLGGAAPKQAMPFANEALAQAVIDWMESPEVLMIQRNQAQLQAKSLQAWLNTLPEASKTYRLIETEANQPLVLVHAELLATADASGLRIDRAPAADLYLPWSEQVLPSSTAALFWQQGDATAEGLRLPLRTAEGNYTSLQKGEPVASEWLSASRALLAQAERLHVQAMHLNVGWPKAMQAGVATGFAEHDPLLLAFMPRLDDAKAPSVAKSGNVDLFIDGQVQPTPQIPIGDEFDIAVRVRNLGAGDASNVTVSANLDPSLRFVSVTAPAGWACPVQPVAGDPSGPLTCAAPSFAAGADQTIVVRQRVPLTVTSGSESYPSFQISSAEPDTNPNNNVDEPGMLAVSHANLGITAQYTAFPLVQGQSVGIIYRIENFGPHSGIDLTATLTLPNNLAFQGVFPSAGWVCPNTPAPDGSGQIQCKRTQMPVGVEQITVQARVRDEAATGGEIVIAGEISSAISEDDVTDNNIVERSTVVREREADVSLTLTDMPMAEAEGSIELNLSAHNQGIDPAQNTQVTMNYPAGTQFQALNAVGWTCSTTPMLSCLRNNLAVNGNADLRVTLAIAADRHNSTINGVASISSDWQDPAPMNNQLPFQIVVKPDADLTAAMSSGPAILGQTLRYTLSAGNDGPDSIGQVTMSFQPAASLRFVALTAPAGWQCTTPAIGSNGPVSCVHADSFASTDTFSVDWSLDPATLAGAALFSQVSTSASNYRELNDLQNATSTMVTVLSDRLLQDSFE